MPGPFGGGMPNLSKMLKEAQQMGDNLKKLEDELAQEQVEGTSGGGMVKAVATGTGDLVSVSIAAEVVDPDDVETLEDLVLTAVRDAMQKATALREEKQASITAPLQGMKLPGLPF